MQIVMKRQSGATLIEVLVTFVILAVGILGLAGLQARALNYNQSALYRSQAIALTDDILDRMRANRSAANNASYATALTSGSGSYSGTTPVATRDLGEWKTQIETQLPSGQGSVSTIGSGSAAVFEITIKWDDSRGASSAQSFVTRSKL